MQKAQNDSWKTKVRNVLQISHPEYFKDGKVDYTQNDRWKLNKELIKYRKMEWYK